MRRGRSLLMLLCLGLLIAVGAPAPAKAAKLVGEEILLGYLNPLTGWAAALGKQNEIAVAVAVDEINADGGIGGIPLKVAKFDTASDPALARELMQRLAENPRVVAVLGPLLDRECAAAFPVANQRGIVAVSSASTAPGITAYNRPWTFRNALDRERVLAPLVELWSARYAIRTVALVSTSSDPFSRREATKLFPKLFARRGVQLAARLSLPIDLPDIANVAGAIQSAKADGLVLASPVAESLRLLRGLRDSGVFLPVLVGAGSTLPDFARQGQAAVEHTMAAQTFWAENPDPRVSSFVKRYSDRAGRMPPTFHAANTYDTIFMIKEAIEKGGVSNAPAWLAEDRAKIRDWWTHLRDYEGVAGLTSMTPSGDTEKQIYILEVRNGAWAKLKSMPR